MYVYVFIYIQHFDEKFSAASGKPLKAIEITRTELNILNFIVHGRKLVHLAI